LRQIQLTNSLTGRKEPLKTITEGKVTMYACGVTVYDYCHIGHACQAVFFDVIRRYLKHAGYQVRYVRNFTDVDDKIIDRAKQNGTSPQKLADDMVQAELVDMLALGIEAPDVQPRVTQSIPQIINMIKTLIQKNHAYVTKDGDVYFQVRSKADYGKLSNRKLDELQAGTRQIVAGEKQDEADFALWKKDESSEASWDSPWSKGRPGWHIECSAMALDTLGPSIDIHGGGRDLMFPHHENEIAQSECANGVPFASYWLHNGLVTVGHQKMSKSLGNFLLIRDALARFPAEALRLNFLLHHYRSNIDFSEEAFRRCLLRLNYYYATLAKLDEFATSATSHENDPAADKLLLDFDDQMSDDFNTASSIAKLNQGLKGLHELFKSPKKIASKARHWAKVIRTIGNVLGLFQSNPQEFLKSLRIRVISEQGIEESYILQQITARTQARAAKDFAQSDKIRDELAQKGIELMDTKAGTDWTIKLTAED
jgi:cysteinyl-tRNA synthetase